MERLLDYDPSNGLKTWFSTSDDEDTWHVRYEQDTSPILDTNKSQQADGFDRRADMWHAARIPIVVMMDWKHKHGVEAWNPHHKDGVRRLLNDPEYRYLRVNHFIL
jgi:hypothetical protein